MGEKTANRESSLVELCKAYGLTDRASDKGIERDWKELSIDYTILARLCMLGCGDDELAYAMGCSVDALNKRVCEDKGCWLNEYRLHHSQSIRMALRRKQLEVALNKGDTRMLMYLGQVYLGQGRGVPGSTSPTRSVPDNTLIQIINQGREVRGNGSSEATQKCITEGVGSNEPVKGDVEAGAVFGETVLGDSGHNGEVK